jgi:peptidoglycan/LPS O-acetylase OafA/YrhL
MDLKAKLFPPHPELPADLTSIDMMKAVAVVLMVIDHVGWLLFPDIEWFRVLGRLCVPLWFFLIGFARTRDIPTRWMVGGIILLISSLLVGLPPLPLSVLFTMALTRLCIDWFWRVVKDNPIYFWWFVLLLVFAGYVTNMVVEYGSMGFLLACCGYAVRNRVEVDDALGQTMHRTVPEVLMMAVLLAYGFLETLSFGFSIVAVMVLAAGLLGEYLVLQNFMPKTFAGTAGKGHTALFQFLGRYSLEIYVIHVLILKAVFGLQQLAAHLL